MGVVRQGIRRQRWIGSSLTALLTLTLLLPVFAFRANAQEQITVRMTSPNASPAERAALEATLAGFEELNPNIDIEYTPIPSTYDEKLQADLAAGNAADIFTSNEIVAPDLVSRGVIQPIDDLMAASGITLDQYYPGLTTPFSFDGQQYGLPKDFSTLAMVYDAEALTEAGIEAAPATWEELRAAAQALSDAGLPPLVFGPNFDRYLAFFYAAGARVVAEDGSAITVNSPEAKEAMEFYYGLYRDGLAQSPTDVGASWAGEAYATGLASMVFEGPWMFGALAETAPDRLFEIAEMPAGPAGQATVAFTGTYFLNAKTFTDKPEVGQAAWEVVVYLVGPEGMAAWTSAAKLLPSRPDLAEGFLAEFPEFEPFLNGSTYALPFAFGPGGLNFNTNANGEIEALFAEEQDVQTTLDNLQGRAEETITLGG